jgi:hypothetical protein
VQTDAKTGATPATQEACEIKPQDAIPAPHDAAQLTPLPDPSHNTLAVKTAVPPPASTVLGNVDADTATGRIVIVSLMDAVDVQEFTASVSQAGVAVMVIGRPPEGIDASAVAGAV